MDGAFADDLGDLVLAAFEFVGERVIALRLLHRVQIFTLHIFDDRNFERVAVADFDGHDRNFMQTGELRGTPAPFAGDDLKPVRRALDCAHHDRLDHAVLLDRVGEFAQLGFSKLAARVARIRLDEFDRHLGLRSRPLLLRGLAADIADQTCKTAAQSRTRFFGHRQLPWAHPPYSYSLFVRSLGSRGSGASRNFDGVAGLVCAQLALALDDLGGELEIGVAADTFDIVDQHWLGRG